MTNGILTAYAASVWLVFLASILLLSFPVIRAIKIYGGGLHGSPFIKANRMIVFITILIILMFFAAMIWPVTLLILTAFFICDHFEERHRTQDAEEEDHEY